MKIRKIILVSLLSVFLCGQTCLPAFAQEDLDQEIIEEVAEESVEEENVVEEQEEIVEENSEEQEEIVEEDSEEEEEIEVENVISGTCGTNVTWEIEDDTLIIQGTGAMYNYPDDLPGYYEYASDIQFISIQPGVTEIGEYAFWSMSEVFRVDIPSTVNIIHTGAFQNCENLMYVFISEGLTTIEKRAFAECDHLYMVSLPSTLKEIEYGLILQSNTLAYIYYNGTKTQWDAISFEDSSDASAIESQNLVCAKGKCGLNVSWTLDMDGELTISGIGAMNDYSVDNGLSQAPYILGKPYFIKKVKIENGVTKIGKYAFYGLSYLIKIEIAGTVTQIGNYAFANIDELDSLIIPSSVTSIGTNALNDTIYYNVYLYPDSYADSYFTEKDKKIYLRNENKILGYQVLDSGSISMQVFTTLSQTVMSDSLTRMEFTLSGGKKITSKGYFDIWQNCVIYECGISAKEMTETITMKLISSSGTILIKKYSFQAYANSIINDSECSDFDKEYVKALLTYGYYTQKYFGYNTSNLPTPIEKVSSIDLSEYKYTLEDNNKNVDYVGARLVLGTEIYVKLYFEGTGQFTLDGEEIQTTTENGYTVVTFCPSFSEDFIIGNRVIRCGKLKISYGIGSYGYVAQKQGKTDLANLIKSFVLLVSKRTVG